MSTPDSRPRPRLRRRGQPKPATPATASATGGPRRVAIYLRRSTDDEHQPYTIEAQRQALENYIASQPGWTLAATYTDDASGATTNREGLQNALRAAAAGRYDVFLVYRLDRLSRKVADVIALLAALDQAGVAFASATEPFETSTPAGRMFIQLVGAFAEFERETIIDRVINGMTMKASQGKWAGGTRPYGYLVDKTTSKLIPHPDEAPVLKDIFTLYTRDRIGTRAIAAELNRRGIPNRTGKPWSGHTINRILDNPAYTGDIAYRDVYVENAHEPLIDRDTFRQANDIAEARASATTHRAASGSDYHCTGLLTCPKCGGAYIGTAANGRSRTYRYYTCHNRNRYGTAGCDAPRLPADDLDLAVLHALHDFFTRHHTLIAEAITHARTQHQDGQQDLRAERDAIASQIHTKNAAVNRYLTAFENGTLDGTTTGQRLTQLRTDIDKLTNRHDDLTHAIATEPTAPAPALLGEIQANISQAITAGTPGERKAMIESFIDEIRITDEGIIPMFKIPHGNDEAPAEDTTSAGASTNTVSAMTRVVGRQGLEP
ncbi:recombinase family protein [Longispora albida]|uniref:recombinase family protein n=1 Tax=Longispora albida TaxID=203523 RepID=UPI00037DBAF4|nr:recombinase family protein [Longispora albida]